MSLHCWRYFLKPSVWIFLLCHFVQSCTKDEHCGLGRCIKPQQHCRCPSGYWGSNCQNGRLRMTAPVGYLTDGTGKYKEHSTVTWLIDSKKANVTIKLQLESFGTECSWDYLYIFDGRSIFDPLVAAWSGVIETPSDKAKKRSVFVTSGSAYVYFYSDKHVAGDGFNFSYRISQCSEDCSPNGFCYNGKCECREGWTGKHCETRVCCHSPIYNLLTDKYECQHKKLKCGIEVDGRGSHAAALQGNRFWVFGGISFKKETNELLSNDLVTAEWTNKKSSNVPAPRHGHTMIYYNNYLIVYGGRQGKFINNEIWKYNIKLDLWQKIKPVGDTPFAVFGHAAVVIRNKMYSFAGFSSVYSFTNNVQVFELETQNWRIEKTEGVTVCGMYGHSAVHDPGSNLVYVHGGHVYCPRFSVSELFDGLFSFDPTSRKWSVLERSGYPRMLHSASIVGGVMLVYGGYTHNGTHSKESKRKCHSDNVHVYSFECKRWIGMKTSTLLQNTERYGHTAVSFNGTVHIFGGFDGVFKNDLVSISLGNCSLHTTKSACINSNAFSNCAWNTEHSKCIPLETAELYPAQKIEKKACIAKKKDCSIYTSCEACSSTGCNWCENTCNTSCNQVQKESLSVIKKCDEEESFKAICNGLATCFACESKANCSWDPNQDGKCHYRPSNKESNATAKCSDDEGRYLCEQFRNCKSCTHSRLKCMWCESLKQCFDTNAYVINFPYGQCHAWANQNLCPKAACHHQKTCRNCFELPGCGWCYDKTMTGIGKCVEGTDTGPHPKTNYKCPANLWHFTECAPCQCHGHSICKNKSRCVNCKDHTIGHQCQYCAAGYFGDARHNGTCKACKCNGHLKSCDRVNGKCQCDAKGVTGDHCDRCDREGDYEGNATNGGYCYYTLKLGFQYTFNMTEKTKINFIARPRKTDRDLEFELDVITRSHMYMNLTVTYKSSMSEHVIVSGYRIGKYKEVFAEDDYKFSAQGGVPSFKVYLYGWKEGTAFRISFAQRPSLFDLVYFLIVFVVCFCVLLVIMIVMWKLKQLYESYQYNRRRATEIREMASRPFGGVTILLNCGNNKKEKIEPSAVAVETYAHGKAAVISTFVELPRCASGVAPFGQSGICIASTLVVTNNAKRILHGNQQKYVYKDKQKLHHGTAVNV